MTIVMTRGDERVEIAGDDALIAHDWSYQGTFERAVQTLSEGFYNVEPLKEASV